jgi:hypothetical protein
MRQIRSGSRHLMRWPCLPPSTTVRIRYKKDRILLAKSAGFGPAAALSGFQSGGRLCRSARSRYRLCPTTPPALTGCGKRGRRVIFIHESAP